jgi:hypothetical protein
MLYVPSTPIRWLRTLAAAIDHAATGLCYQQWQRDVRPRLQPVLIASVSRTHDGVK